MLLFSLCRLWFLRTFSLININMVCLTVKILVWKRCDNVLGFENKFCCCVGDSCVLLLFSLLTNRLKQCKDVIFTIHSMFPFYFSNHSDFKRNNVIILQNLECFLSYLHLDSWSSWSKLTNIDPFTPKLSRHCSAVVLYSNVLGEFFVPQTGTVEYFGNAQHLRLLLKTQNGMVKL